MNRYKSIANQRRDAYSISILLNVSKNDAINADIDACRAMEDDYNGALALHKEIEDLHMDRLPQGSGTKKK